MDCEIGHFIPPTDRAATELLCKPWRYPFEKAQRKFIVQIDEICQQGCGSPRFGANVEHFLLAGRRYPRQTRRPSRTQAAAYTYRQSAAAP